MCISDWSSDVCSSDLLGRRLKATIVELLRRWPDGPVGGAGQRGTYPRSGSDRTIQCVPVRQDHGQPGTGLQLRAGDCCHPGGGGGGPVERLSAISDERSVGKVCVSTCSTLWSLHF